MSQEGRRLPLPSKLGFGLGGGAEGLHNIAVNTFLIYYYQQVYGLPGTLGGTALLITMLFDAVSDPLVGMLSDRVRSKRWGRRHPFMLLSAIPLALSFVALFSPPSDLSQGQTFAWLTGFAVLVRLSLTLYNIPHLALGAEMAQRYDDRTAVFTFSTASAFVIGILGYFCAFQIFFPDTPEFSPGTLDEAAYTPFALTFGFTMALFVLACAWSTLREIPHLPRLAPALEHRPFRSALTDLAAIFSNRSFLAIFGGLVMAALVLNVEEVLNSYMGLHFWELGSERLSYLIPATLLGLPGSIVVVSLLPRRFDKRNTLMVCLASVVVISNLPIVLRLLEVSWFPANGTAALFWTLIGFRVAYGCVAPATLIMINSIFADICDEIELQTGTRLEGLVYATRSFALKGVSGIGNFLGGVVLDLIAFPPGARTGTVAPEIIFHLGLVVGPVGAVCTLLGLACYAGYKLDRRRHAEIVAELARRRAQASVEMQDPDVELAAAPARAG